jgi:putative membrane protein
MSRQAAPRFQKDFDADNMAWAHILRLAGCQSRVESGCRAWAVTVNLKALNRFMAPESSLLSEPRARYFPLCMLMHIEPALSNHGKSEMVAYKPPAVSAVLVQTAVFILFAALSGCSRTLDSNEFLAKAMQDGMAEIQTSHLALQKPSDADVKKFAARMIDDHSKIDQEITELAKTTGAKLPQEITAEQKIKFDDMSKLSGHDFDKRFMHYKVEDHKEYVKRFSGQAERGSDVGVKAFAARTLPTLKEHLQFAQGVYTKVQP